MVKKIFAIVFVFICLNAFNSSAQIRINSQFRPYSYDEMVAPLQAYQQFYNQCLGRLSNLLENAETIEEYIDKNKDPECWRRYTNYYNSVVNEYNSIRNNGTNQGTRNRISNLEREFKVINSLGNAYNRRADLSNTQFQRIRSTNERCDRYYSDMSLDEFLDGKTPSVTYYQQ